MKFLKKEKSKLLNRTDLVIELEHIGKSTPSNSDIKKQIASNLKTKEELIVIDHVYTKFGEGISKIHAKAYDSEKALKDIEPKPNFV
jgi:ribosomal protein S24E